MSKHKQAQDIQKTKQKTVTPPKQKMQMGKTAVIPSPIPALQRAYTDHNTLTSAEAQSLQSTIGNQALGRLTIQRKMTLGPVGDKYEQKQMPSPNKL